MNQVSKKIINFLEGEKVKYEVIEHRTTYTAKDRAATNLKNKIKPEEIVKALVMKADNDYFLALVSSNKMMDKGKLKKIANVAKKKEAEVVKKEIKSYYAPVATGASKDRERKELEKELKKMKAYKKIDFAKEAWMKKNISGKIGAVPPFSGIVKIPIFVDGALLRQKQLYLGSGEYEFSIKMTPAQYQKLEKNLVKGSFSKK